MSKSHEQYTLEKLAWAKILAQQNKFFRKARAIIVKGDKLLVLHKLNNNSLQLPGGGINDKENAKTATEREVLEETNALVKITHYLGKYYYTAKLDYQNTEFLSKRVEFIYICEFIKFCKDRPLGIEGEFGNNVELVEIPFNQLNKISMPPRLRQKALEYLNSHYAQ